jgi:hypothetical protein
VPGSIWDLGARLSTAMLLMAVPAALQPSLAGGATTCLCSKSVMTSFHRIGSTGLDRADVTEPLERLDGEQGVLGFREAAPRLMPNHKGVLTQRRTLLVPPGMTPSSVRRLARYLKCRLRETRMPAPIDVLNVLQKLPPICASVLLSTGERILLKRGVMGYWPAPLRRDVDGFNRRHNVTAAQREAMEIGSLCGWDVPGADPDLYLSRGDS